jgi:hypothetical protein
MREGIGDLEGRHSHDAPAVHGDRGRNRRGRRTGHPGSFNHIEIHDTARGRALDPAQVERAVEEEDARMRKTP